MGFTSFLIAFFLVSHLPVLHSSSSCPSSFDCGTLGPIKFPFTNNTPPQCGLCTLRCDVPIPEVILGTEGRSYQVSGFVEDTIKINDPMLKHLIESNNCDFFSNISSLMALDTRSSSFTISPNLTFFKCNTNSHELENQTDKYFFGNYTYRDRTCHGYTVYYSYPNQQVRVPTPGSYPRNCDVFQLPVASSVEGRDIPSDPFSLLTSDFFVEYHLSEECLTCLHDGGQCLPDPDEFHCSNETGGRKRLALILKTGQGTGH